MGVAEYLQLKKKIKNTQKSSLQQLDILPLVCEARDVILGLRKLRNALANNVSPQPFPHPALFTENSIPDKEKVPVCTDLESFPELQRLQTQHPPGPIL